MKKITILITVLMITVFSYAQSNKEEVDMFQAAAGMQKKEAVAAFVQPTDAQKDAFWKLYDEYEVTRKLNGVKRMQLLDQYAAQYNKMNDAQAETFLKEVTALQSATDKLIVTYSNKIKKVTSPTVALQFYQIENYILAVVRAEVLDAVPFVKVKK